MTLQEIKKIFEMFESQKEYSRLEIKTDIAEGKGLNGTHYLNYYHGFKNSYPYDNEYYKYTIDINKVSDDNILVFNYKTEHVNEPQRCHESFCPQNEEVFLQIKHITNIIFDTPYPKNGKAHWL